MGAARARARLVDRCDPGRRMGLGVLLLELLPRLCHRGHEHPLRQHLWRQFRPASGARCHRGCRHGGHGGASTARCCSPRSTPRWPWPRCAGRLLGIVFLFILAFTVTEAAQVVGTLLVLSLAITPAAAAHRLANSPLAVAGLAVVFALVAADGALAAQASRAARSSRACSWSPSASASTSRRASWVRRSKFGAPCCCPQATTCTAGEVGRHDPGQAVCPTVRRNRPPTLTAPPVRARRSSAALRPRASFRSAQETTTSCAPPAERIGLTTVYRHLQRLADEGTVDVLRPARG